VQRGGNASAYFWSISKAGAITGTSTTYMMGQPFLFDPVVPVGTAVLSRHQCSIYPTLVASHLNVTVPDEVENAELILYSVGGNKLGCWVLTSGLNTIDMTALPAGLVIGQIRSASFRESVKFIKVAY